LDAADASTITLNGSNVSQWNDKSGNARHATQSTAGLQPLYGSTVINSKPALRFASEGGAAQDSLTASISVTQNTLSVYTVFQKTGSSGNSKHRYGRIVSFWNTNDNSNNPADYGNSNGFIAAFIGQQDTFSSVAAPNIVSFRNGASITAQSLAYQNGGRIIGTILSGSSVSFRLDGNETTGTTTVTAMNSNQMLIGSSPAGSDSEMSGDISEVVVFLSALTTADSQRMEGYLAHKWGLTANLPANHPYKNAAP
jgi:hypothetical protein